MSDFKLILPHGITNFVEEPSFEGFPFVNWSTGGINTIAQSTVEQTRGLYSCLSTFQNSVAMLIYTGVVLPAAGVYTISMKIFVPTGWDATTPFFIDALNFVGSSQAIIQEWDTTTFDEWVTLELRLTVVGGDLTGDFRILYTAPAATAGRFIYVDEVQAELGSEITTYCDGDQDGCAWNGLKDFSTSERSAASRAGGLIRDLQDDLHFDISAIRGAQIANQRVNIDRFSILPGGSLNSIKVNERTMTMTGVIRGTSLENLHANKQELVSAILPDSYPKDAEGFQPVRLRYTGAAIEKEIAAHYQSRLEGNLNSREPCGWERVQIRWVCPSPFWHNVLDSAQLLDTSDSATFRVVSARLRSTGQWDVLGPPAAPGIAVYNEVRDIVIAADGSIIMGGRFTNFNNDADADRIVQWDGTTWSWPAGEGVDDNSVIALLFAPDGTLYAAGDFTAVSAGQANTNGIATWTGAAWVALGTSSDDFQVNALAIGLNGDIYAAGAFTGMGGVLNTNRIARWDGAAWNALSNGIDDLSVLALAVGVDGTVYAGGTFTQVDGGSAFVRIAQWDGTAWASMGDANGTVFALTVDPVDGTLYAGGNFTTIGGITSLGLAKWNGTAWTDISDGLAVAPVVRTIEIGPDRVVYVGGVVFGRAAKGSGNGSDWVQLDIDFAGGATIYTFAIGKPDPVIYSNYDIYVGHDQAVAIVHAGIVTANNGGTEIAFPQFVVERTGGTGATIKSLRNESTGKELLLDYDLLDDERLTIDLTPTNKSFISSFFSSRPDAILSGSDTGEWSLIPGDNEITCLVSVTGGATVTAWLQWSDQYNGID